MRVFGSFGVGFYGGGFGGTKVRGAAANASGGSGRGKAETRIGLFAATGRFVEDGPINFGDNDVVAAAGIECGGGAEGKSIEFGLGEVAEIDGWD